MALEEKKITENIDNNTIDKYRYDFKRYIDEDLGSRLITDLTDVDLKAYTQELTNRLTLKEKSFLAYKGILNLIYDYALLHEIIMKNPVIKIKNKIYLKNCDTKKAKSEDKLLSLNEIQQVKSVLNRRKRQTRYNGYCVKAYMTELSMETGVRVAELCSLEEQDIANGVIHIHTQQLYTKVKGGKVYRQALYTKNEKGISQDGRIFPITPRIKQILDENKTAKEALGIKSKYVFCTLDGDWIKADAYQSFLRRMMKSLGFSVTNNHAFRMSLNSNVFIPKGIPVTERARLLGHSVETNLRYYSFDQKDNIDYLRDVLSDGYEADTPGHPQVIPFPKSEPPA